MSTKPIEALSGVANACQVLPHVVTGGQPSAEHFVALREAGVEVVIDLRDPMEPRPCDQPALMRELGFEYINISITPATMTRDNLERVLTAVRAAGTRPTLVHCASGNRVGGALYAWLVLDHGFSEEDATNAAMRMGLRSVDVLEWGKSAVAEGGREHGP